MYSYTSTHPLGLHGLYTVNFFSSSTVLIQSDPAPPAANQLATPLGLVISQGGVDIRYSVMRAHLYRHVTKCSRVR